jgi:hypothetical protein
MIEYWSVIGRACVDGGFRDKLLGLAENERDHAALARLFEFLCGPPSAAGCGLRLSRWELCDVNRILLILEADRTGKQEIWARLQGIEGAWYNTKCFATESLNKPEIWGLLGLIGIDSLICGYYVGTPQDPASLRALLQRPPLIHFRQTAVELEDPLARLAAFLAHAQGGKQLEGLEKAIWVVPSLRNRVRAALELLRAILKALLFPGEAKTRCAGGFTPNAQRGKNPYRHLSSPFIGAVGSIALDKGGTLHTSKL